MHPNTVRVFDFGEDDDGKLYFAMELLEGVDLQRLVERTGPLPVGGALHLFRQAASALSEAHEKGFAGLPDAGRRLLDFAHSGGRVAQW